MLTNNSAHSNTNTNSNTGTGTGNTPPAPSPSPSPGPNPLHAINSVAVAVAAAAITNPNKEIAELKVTVRKLTDKVNYLNQLLISLQKQVQLLVQKEEGVPSTGAGAGSGGGSGGVQHVLGGSVGGMGGGGVLRPTHSNHPHTQVNSLAHSQAQQSVDLFLTDMQHASNSGAGALLPTGNNNTIHSSSSGNGTLVNTLAMFDNVEYAGVADNATKSNRPPKKRHLDNV